VCDVVFLASNGKVLRLHPLLEARNISVQRPLVTREREPARCRIGHRGIADTGTPLVGRDDDSGERAARGGSMVTEDFGSSRADLGASGNAFIDGCANGLRIGANKTVWSAGRARGKVSCANDTASQTHDRAGDVGVLEELPDALGGGLRGVDLVDDGFGLGREVVVSQNGKAVTQSRMRRQTS